MTRNCLVYDTDKMRHYICGVTTAALLVGFCFDVAVWFVVGDLEMYDGDDDVDQGCN